MSLSPHKPGSAARHQRRSLSANIRVISSPTVGRLHCGGPTVETALWRDSTVWKLQCSATDNQKHCTDEHCFTTGQNVSDHSLRCKRPCDSLIHCNSCALLKLQATPGKTYWIARLNIFQQIRVICHIALNSDVTALNFDCSAMSHTILHALR